MPEIGLEKVRVRFAPSPTGMLHIGGLRTALFNFLFARHHQGTFLLRIEDTDKERSEQRYTDGILTTLRWCSLTPDEPLVVQSERHAEHMRVAQQLVTSHNAYYCYCTPQELLDRVGKKNLEGVAYAQYDGFCRKFIGEALNAERSYVIRYAVPEDCTEVTVQDLVKGRITFKADTFDDFILVRSDGTPMYNFVAVVDDASMGITHVIRGEEHLINTPKQILLYRACGYAVPFFAHLPLILGPDGSKLSKRDAAAHAFEYMAKGYLPHALCNYLVRLGWAHGDQEIFTLPQMIEAFSLSAISSKGALFDTNKLKWVNSMHIKAASATALYDYMKSVMQVPLDTHFSLWSYTTIMQLIDLYKLRSGTLRDLYHELQSLHTQPTVYEGAALSVEQKKLLDAVITTLSTGEFTHDILSETIKEFCHTQQIKLGALGPLLRVALTGKKDAPGLYDLLTALGKDESLARLRNYYSFSNGSL